MAIYKNCIPDLYVKSIDQIPYEQLRKQGKKALLFDLDNTIIDYHQTKLDVKRIEFLNELEKDFKILIISNSFHKRVYGAVGHHFEFVAFARKPLKSGFKKAMKKLRVKSDEIVMIGDQLMTDIFGGNRAGFYTILVDAVSRKTDKFLTRINRGIEKHYLKKIQKKAPEKYDEVLRAYAEKHQ